MNSIGLDRTRVDPTEYGNDDAYEEVAGKGQPVSGFRLRVLTDDELDERAVLSYPDSSLAHASFSGSWRK